MSKYIKLEDAIERLNQLYHSYEVEEWLKSLPTIEVSEDCIDRKALLEQKYKAKDIFDTEYEDWFVFVPTIEKAPSVVPKRAEGEWVDRNDEGVWNYCSVCGEQSIDLFDYCPNCGAKMKG